MTEPGTPTSHDSTQPARRVTPLHRAMNRFTSDPSSARNAIVLIVIADLAAVLLGALVIWTVDRREYEQFTTAVWYILQTVTTVGYGDVTPTEPIGRFIGGAVMLLAIASLSILTASITSAFIDARQAARREERDDLDQARWAELNAPARRPRRAPRPARGRESFGGLIAPTTARWPPRTGKEPRPCGPGLCRRRVLAQKRMTVRCATTPFSIAIRRGQAVLPFLRSACCMTCGLICGRGRRGQLVALIKIA